MDIRRLPLFALSLVVVGCSGSTTTPSTTTPPPKTTSEKPDDTSSKETPVTETKTPPSAEKPKLETLAANLKHEGYEYYGLGNTTPLKMSLVQGARTLKGAQETELEEVKADGAVFRQAWTEELAMNGTSKVRVTPEGVFGIEAQGNALNPPQMEMPAKITPGFKWSSHTKLTVNGETVESTDSKIVGMKTITLGKKPHSVLVVTRSSKVDISGKKKVLDSTEYYEKGIGPVKVDVKVSGGGDPVQTFSMEHTE